MGGLMGVLPQVRPVLSAVLLVERSFVQNGIYRWDEMKAAEGFFPNSPMTCPVPAKNLCFCPTHTLSILLEEGFVFIRGKSLFALYYHPK